MCYTKYMDINELEESFDLVITSGNDIDVAEWARIWVPVMIDRIRKLNKQVELDEIEES